MPSSDLEYGNATAGVIAGILVFLMLGWLNVYGWIAAGLAVGLISRGAARGLVAAIVTGAVVTGILVAITILATPADVGNILAYTGTGVLPEKIVGSVQHIMALKPLILIRSLAIDAIAVPAVSGFIGGSIMSPRPRGDTGYEAPAEQAESQEA